MADMIWQCNQMRAGQLYNRLIFPTREEAVEFVQKMQQVVPDQVFSIEAVEARKVWN